MDTEKTVKALTEDQLQDVSGAAPALKRVCPKCGAPMDTKGNINDRYCAACMEKLKASSK